MDKSVTIQQRPLEIKVVRQFQSDMFAQAFLAAFYGLEMAKSMGWSTEQRFMQMRQAQYMLAMGESRMYTAAVEPGKPVGMIITTKTSTPAIRRLDSLLVAEPYRRRGIARRLFEEARKGGAEFHSFSAPEAVEWHLANGFKSLGPKPEGTMEMFTGSTDPLYSFAVPFPALSDEDQKAIHELATMESTLKLRP